MKEFFKKVVLYLERRGFFNILSDKSYLKIMYKVKMGKKLNLNNPKTYNEKLQWIKLYDRNPEYSKMVDKDEVKRYVEDKIGKEYVIPTLGVWDKFEDIDFDNLPNQFVLKCTHDSGGVVICKNKEEFDIAEAKSKLSKSLKENYYYHGREWPYKNVKPRIIAEKYMEDESRKELKDYKFFCFNGEAKMMFVATDRFSDSETCFDFYDKEFKHLDIKNGHPNTTKEIEKPQKYEEMIRLSEILSENLTCARIDFYNINAKIYFGEITFFHWGGMVPFEPEEWDSKLGDWIKLPCKNEK